MILDDFVMLGTTVPEPNSDGRIFVCSAGVSAELRRLVRIYPLARHGIPHRWNRYRVPVERNPSDHRPESFKVRGNRNPGAHERINAQFEHVGKVPDTDRAQLLEPFKVGSIKEANAKRLSLAIIHPDTIDLHFEHNANSPDSPELRLFDVEPSQPQAGARRFPLIPRLRFMDECGGHNLMLRDWGCYELQRKQGEMYFRDNLAGALHLRDSSSLLVGNMNNHRQSWLVISVLQGIRSEPTLFDALPSSRTAIPAKVRRSIYERDGWKCVVPECGSTDNLTIDHKLPVVRGGTNEPDNLQTMCRPCNIKKSSTTGEAA